MGEFTEIADNPLTSNLWRLGELTPNKEAVFNGLLKVLLLMMLLFAAEKGVSTLNSFGDCLGFLSVKIELR